MAFAEKLKKTIKSRAFLFKLVVTIFVFICIPLLAMQILAVSEPALAKKLDEKRNKDAQAVLEKDRTVAANL